MTVTEYRTPRAYIFRHGTGNTCPTRAWRVTMTPEEYSKRQYRYPCPTCGREREGRAIDGRVSHKHKCGAKCRSSKGWQCECSCGGANHGAGFDIDTPDAPIVIRDIDIMRVAACGMDIGE